MKNIIGPPVTGNNFFGREKELKLAWQSIQDGNNLILPSPRRIGKTSFALKLQEIAREKGWKTIHMNLEEYDELKFIKDLTAKLIELSSLQSIKAKGKKILQGFARLKPKINYEGAELSYEIEGKEIDPYDEIDNLIDHNKNTLIFLDELTILLQYMKAEENGERRVGRMLHWMRKLRINENSKVRWILCSSVGITNFTHDLGFSDSINDLDYFKLRTLTPPESMMMLQKLSNEYNLELNEELQKLIIQKLKYCIPFFLQVIFKKIYYLYCVEEVKLNEELIEKTYKEITSEDHFNTWVERIQKQYGDIKDLCFKILKFLCQTPASRRSIYNQIIETVTETNKAEEITAKLLHMLKNDGYLMEEEGTYMFRSPLIRDFWYNRFVK